MGRRTPFQVGPWCFDSKAAAQGREKAIRERWKYKGPLRGVDEQFVRSLIHEHYPTEWLEEKLKGRGIKQIHVSAAPPPFQDQNTCFWATLTDATEVDFSVAKHCFRKGTPLDDFRAACRSAARPWIEAYLQKYFDEYQDANGNVACQLSGEQTARKRAVVHHDKPTFNELVGNFICASGVDVGRTALEMIGYEDGESAKHFRDRRLASEFMTYHAQHAGALLIVDRDRHSRLPRAARAPMSDARLAGR